jgi:hypothetical protein
MESMLEGPPTWREMVSMYGHSTPGRTALTAPRGRTTRAAAACSSSSLSVSGGSSRARLSVSSSPSTGASAMMSGSETVGLYKLQPGPPSLNYFGNMRDEHYSLAALVRENTSDTAIPRTVRSCACHSLHRGVQVPREASNHQASCSASGGVYTPQTNTRQTAHRALVHHHHDASWHARYLVEVRIPTGGAVGDTPREAAS